MSARNLSSLASELIVSYGNSANNLIAACQAGGERMVSLLEQRWNEALRQSRSELSAETARNAAAAQLAFSVVYTQGLNLTASGARQLVNQLVKLAETGIERVAANASAFEKKTGVKMLDTLARASTPGVLALGKLAAQIEQGTADLAHKISGSDGASVKRSTAFRQRRTAKAD